MIRLTTILLLSFILQTGFAQILTKAETDFLQQNTKTIRQSQDTGTSDWKSLASQLKHKKLIFLGEFNHGSKEVFQIRNDLIRYLHQHQGINTILFESGIGELLAAEFDKEKMTSAQMIYGLFSGWRTKEFRELMQYIKQQNISIAGFDVQRSGNSFSNALRRQAEERKLDTLLYINLEERYGSLQRSLSNRKSVYDSLQATTSQLINEYQRLYSLFCTGLSTPASRENMFTRRTIINRIQFLSYMLQSLKDRDLDKRWAARDAAMAENIKWLADSIYKNERMIIVAHNYHIAKHSAGAKVMGEILQEKYGNDMYSLGVFAGEGSFANNNGVAEKMVAPDSSSLDIKHIILSRKKFVSFLPVPAQQESGSNWLFKEITVNDTFIDLKGTNKLALSKFFDGLLLLSHVSIPEKD